MSDTVKREEALAAMSEEELAKETRLRISGFYGARHYSDRTECWAWQLMQECIDECQSRNIPVEQWIEESKESLRQQHQQQTDSINRHRR